MVFALLLVIGLASSIGVPILLGFQALRFVQKLKVEKPPKVICALYEISRFEEGELKEVTRVLTLDADRSPGLARLFNRQ